jgi:hypothetical protein
MAIDSTSLIEQLREDRDYGSYSLDELRACITEGTVSIEVGQRLPVLRDTSTGQILRGSGPTLRSGLDFRDILATMGDRYMESVVEGLVRAAEGGDVKAAIFLIDRWAGRNSPPKIEGGGVEDLMAEINGNTGRVRR